jgi:hypothetical protein
VEFLRSLDPNLHVAPVRNGTCYCLKIQRDGWNFGIKVLAFQDRVWLLSDLGNPLEASQMTAEALRQLLVVNDPIGPSHFSYYLVDGRYQLRANHMVDGPVALELFRARLDEFLGDIKNPQSYEAWRAAITPASSVHNSTAIPR